MDNGIYQLNAGYDALQDRIRFCFNTKDGNEFRFWFTRRYLNLLLTTLSNIATGYANARAAGNITSRQALSEFAHMQALQETDVKSAFEGGAKFPLGEEPLLVSKIVVKNDGAGNTTLGLTPENDQGADIGLNESLTHLIADLLTRTAMHAEWQLTLAPLVPPLIGDNTGKARLH
jgi:hypothetical protein